MKKVFLFLIFFGTLVFSFSNTTIPNLFNKEGMPVNLFRTDQWEVKTDAVVK